MGYEKNAAPAASFNHDGGAHGYDEDVLNEQDPIRAGYEATLEWVAESAGILRIHEFSNWDREPEI